MATIDPRNQALCGARGYTRASDREASRRRMDQSDATRSRNVAFIHARHDDNDALAGYPEVRIGNPHNPHVRSSSVRLHERPSVFDK